MAALTYITGVAASTGYVRVGHNSGGYNNDAVWSFSLTQAGAAKLTGITFSLVWNNTAAGTGWSDSRSYTFAISTSKAAGRTAYSDTHIAKKAVTLSGASGTATVAFTGLSLSPGTTYYLRANFSGTTLSTMKAFKQAGNTVALDSYTKQTFAITYNANGGSGTTPAGQTKTYGAALTLRSTSGLSRTGYTCLGWSTSATATTATYASGGNYTANAAATLYAVWSANTVEIHYWGNGATGVGSNAGNTSKTEATLTTSIKYTNRTDANLYNVTSLFTKTGYHRASGATAWRVGSASATTYWDEASQDIPASYFSSSTARVNLYVNWAANGYTLTFNANGGTTPTAFKTVIYDSPYGTLPIPVKSGYRFLGWFTASEGGDLITASTVCHILEAQTLFAHWKAQGSVRVYREGVYRMALPHVYTGSVPRQCVPYIYSNGAWKTGL